MKIVGIFFLVYLLNLGFIYVVDRLAGVQSPQTLRNLTAPFSYITFPEIVIVGALLSMLFAPPVISFIRRRFKQRNN
jgi:hypothetical protein